VYYTRRGRADNKPDWFKTALPGNPAVYFHFEDESIRAAISFGFLPVIEILTHLTHSRVKIEEI
jgi:hypothetical protein